MSESGTLYLGDCLEVMKTLPKHSVDLILGSPPYEDARTYYENGEDLGIARKTEEWVKWMIEVFHECLRVSKGLVALVVGHGKGARKWSGGPALLCADLIRQGVILRSPLWYKRNGIMGSGGNDWLRADLEWIICATNSKEKLPWSDNTTCGTIPKYDPGGVTSHRVKSGRRVNESKKEAAERLGINAAANRHRNKKGNLTKREEGGAALSRGIYVPPERTNPGNVIDCGAVGGGHLGSNISHENEAPYAEKLADFMIRSFCPPEGVVLDPFIGSGTTLACAIKTGRKFIGVDLRESQINLCKRRVKQARINKGFF